MVVLSYYHYYATLNYRALPEKKITFPANGKYKRK